MGIYVIILLRKTAIANQTLSKQSNWRRISDIKLWDGVGNVVINTFTKAHDGNEVCSVAFSRNGKVCVVKCSQVFSCLFVLLDISELK
jgi:WD40 repeat protein